MENTILEQTTVLDVKHLNTGRIKMSEQSDYIIPAQTRIGHVHLKVADLERSLAFYRDLLGFELTMRYGSQVAFLSAGGYHHHIGHKYLAQ